jgi:hypothetical protein
MTGDHTGGAASGDSVAVTFKLSIGEYARATVALIRISRGARLMGIAFLVFAVLGAGLSRPLQDLGTFVSVVAIPGVIGLAFLTGYLALPLCWLAMRRRRDLVESPITFTADDAGLRYATALYDSHVTWQFVRRVRDVGPYLFFDNGAGATLFVPKRAIDPSAYAALLRLLTDKLPGSGFRVGSPPTFLDRFGAWIVVIASVALVGIEIFVQLGTESPGNLRVGDCFDRPAFGTLDSIARRSCTEPHDAEIIGSIQFPGQPTAVYPGAAGFTAFNESIPSDQIGEFLRPGLDSSLLATGAQFPSESAWAIGDRRVLIYATSVVAIKLSSPVGIASP